jgi:membrane protein
MFEGLNAVYEENEKRGFFKLNVVSLASTLGALAFVIVSLLTITVVPKLLSFLGLLGIGEAVNSACWPLLLVVACFMIGVIYYFSPSREQPQWRWISPGSIFAAVIWIAASLWESSSHIPQPKPDQTRDDVGGGTGVKHSV